ncbi:MAG: hypothetical protein ACFCU5_05720 [Pleurocapsa sp.]
MPINNKLRRTQAPSLPFKLIFGLGVSLTLIASQFSPAAAQNSTNEGYQSNERDSLYGDGTFGDLNPMDFIHNAKFRQSRNAQEFDQDSQVQINNSALEFKQQQQQRILEFQNNNNPAEPEENN